jgi:hypothetical protein
MNYALQSAYTLATQDLTTFANSAGFQSKLQVAFGSQYNQSVADRIRQQWAGGIFSLPSIEVVDSLGTANGAYAASNHTIYISNSFLATHSAPDVAATIIEEVGHWLDGQINTSDSAGDEGHIFSALVRGLTLMQRNWRF